MIKTWLGDSGGREDQKQLLGFNLIPTILIVIKKYLSVITIGLEDKQMNNAQNKSTINEFKSHQDIRMSFENTKKSLFYDKSVFIWHVSCRCRHWYRMFVKEKCCTHLNEILFSINNHVIQI